MQIFCWQSNELKFTATVETANPFLDVELTARFTGPNGETLVLTGYWDGGKTYCVRFAPTAVGIWRYETSASNGDPGLAASGEIVCVPYTGELPIYRHGFLRVSSDKTHLEHADGTPFLWLGYTHRTFVTEERWDESNCVQYDSQFRACVDRRAQQGFNVYQCNFREGVGEGIFGKNLTLLRETERGLLPDAMPLLTADASRSTIVGYFSPGAWRSFALHGLKAKSYTGYTMDPATGHKIPVTYEIKDGTLRVEDYRRTSKPDLVLVLRARE